jgi:D-serine deaminase-like pyridoxal phosphate-dependent protein
MVLQRSALEHNVGLLATTFRDRGVSHAPHGKTTMSPQVWRLQLAAGAWAITVATAWQARVAAEVGVPRILIANEVVDAGGLAWLRSALEGSEPELITQADSVEGVERMAHALAGVPRRLPVLIDVGQAGGRTGVRSVDEGLAVARAVVAAEPLRLSGVTCFEGAAPGPTPEARLGSVTHLLAVVREVATLVAPDIERDGARELIVSGGGSRYVDRVIDALTEPFESPIPVRVVVRSGSAVIHDHGLYADSPLSSAAGARPGLRPTIEVWAHVLSTPEPGLAIVGAGRRDLPYDAGLPVVVKLRHEGGAVEPAVGIEITALNDQHAFATTSPHARLSVGDLVGLGISHPCSAFDRWRWIAVVDDDYAVVDAFETIF